MSDPVSQAQAWLNDRKHKYTQPQEGQLLIPALQPCPFCGFVFTDAMTIDSALETDAHYARGSGKWGAVVCPGCAAIGPEVRANYEPPSFWGQAAADQWNRRVSAGLLGRPISQLGEA